MITKFNEYIKENNSNNQFFKTYDETKEWLDDMGIENYTINPDLTVDVNGYVNLHNFALDKISVQFGKVIGDFDCSYNFLITLKGIPYEIIGDYRIDCSGNYLYSIKGLSIYILKKTIDEDWYQDLNDILKEEWFNEHLEENPELISLIDFETSSKFKDKWDHLFNANKFDLI